MWISPDCLIGVMNQSQWRDYFCIPTLRFSCFNIVLYTQVSLSLQSPKLFLEIPNQRSQQNSCFQKVIRTNILSLFFSTIYKRLDSQLISWFTSVDLSDYILSSSHLVFQRFFFSLTVISCVEKRMDGNMNKSLNFKNEFPAKPVIIEKRRVMRSTFNY